ncbi:glycosyltransferase family 39 protein [Kutzneria sp. CA-103260]|uniref:glycosyltransferase family 39 protein n=1 Tax=Kutzneria sp. CA-103260 TaxID=2802641 RepID=UPI002012AD2E|nr:glycosyltransferase family 39 protein [Kutzneria sp. CA-103260]
MADFAVLPVVFVAGLLGVVLLAASGRYGYFGDELYFVAAGHHLDFGYADQPPLVPFLALIADTIAPGNIAVVRIPAILATVAGIVVAALIARELGGRRRAQIITAAAYAVAPVVDVGGHLLATTSVDLFWWTAITWLLVRWVRLREDRLLLWAGLATAVDLQAKYLIVSFWVLAGVAILIAGPRDIFRSKMLWLGAGIAVLTSVPSLLWQADHGWPQIQMIHEVAVEQEGGGGGGASGFLLALGGAGGVIGVPLGLYGLWRAIRLPQYRFLAIVAVSLVVVFIVMAGRPYYAAGILPVLWALAAVGLDGPRRRRWVPWVAWPAVALSVAMLLQTLPLEPRPLRGDDDTVDALDVESVGWPQVTGDIAAAYRALPEDVRRHTAIVGDSYWLASAIALYGPARGLPAAYSPNRGYWYFGVPPESATDVLYVNALLNTDATMRRHFAKVTQVATVDNKLGVNNLYQGASISLCVGRDESWSRLWPELRNL